ncbi:MAG TPA: dihydrolipoamide acetyltransferase [bacterium]|nr:dihydrolipoamide acetyltransferase [bacterium]
MRNLWRRGVFSLVLGFLFVLWSQEISQTTPLGTVSDEDGAEVPLSNAEQGEKTEQTTDGEQEVNLKLRNLEEKINSLKDKVFRAKQRLATLQETVLSGALAGARASVVHLNEVGSTFDLVSVVYYLDEAPVFKWVEGSGVDIKTGMSVFDGSVVPGPHHLSVYLIFRGSGYGVFSYMRGYTFKLKAGYSFNVEEGQLVEVSVTAEDRGTLVKLDNRLYISFDIKKKVFEQRPQTDAVEGTIKPAAE